MILSVTLNPLVERKFFFRSVNYYGSNRTSVEKVLAGGKGINVCRQLNALNIDNIALTFEGGFSGKLLKKLIYDENIKAAFIHTADESRNTSVIVNEEKRIISSFFGRNSEITSGESSEFLLKLEKMINNCEIVVFAGSSPSESTDHIFSSGIEIARKMDKIAIVDTYGSHLNSCINAKPRVIHINLGELSEFYNTAGEDEILKILDELYSKGIKQVFITDGDKTIYASNFDFHFKIVPPQIIAADPTGSGDAFTSGIIYGWHNNLTFEESAIIATCLGTVNASKYDLCNSTLQEAEQYRTGVQFNPVGKKMKIIDDKPR